MSSLKPVRGTHDLLGEELRAHNWITETARNIAYNYGCQDVQTPIFEFSEVFHRTLGESSDVVSKETYTFADRNDESLTLRPEGTAGIARAFISNGWAQKTPLKLFYAGPMFRYERPQKGRQRQFHQLGVEFVGVNSFIGDVECMAMANVFFEQLGLKDKVALEINSIGDSDSRNQYRKNLVSFLEKYKNDLSEDSQKRLQVNPLRILDSKDKGDQKILEGAPSIEESLNKDSKEFFDNTLAALTDLGIQYTVNPKLVRGLDYYCHCVFEFKADELGAQDTVLAGGRYDKLIDMMGGPVTPSVGFAAGIERLSLITQNLPALTRPVVIIPLGELAEKEALKICQDLRSQNIKVDMAYSGNMSKRMKKANNINAAKAIILGEDEIKAGEATIKNLDSGDQEKVKLTELITKI